MQLIRAAVTVGAFTAISRITGFVRDLMIAAVLGASLLADAFFVSFKLANFLRRLFAEGAFNAGFVPMFARTLEGEGEAAARAFGRETLAVMSVVLLIVVLLAEIFMPWLVRAIAIGFEPGEERYGLAVELSRITFPYLMCISLAALFSGVLNSIGRFAAAAFAPVLLNLILVTSLLLAAQHPKTPAHALAWGVAVAGVAQLVWVAWACRRQGMGLALQRPRITSRIKKLFGLILPGAVGAGVYQINLLVDMFFASTLPVGAISFLFYADRLNQLPLGIIGVAMGTALLPLLTRQLRAGDVATAQRTQNRAAEFALLLTLPATAALIAIGEPIIRVLFERGAFTAADTAATSSALVAFAIGLPAYVLIKVLAPGFFAREDTATPVKIAAVCLAANIAIILLLIGPMAHTGIALATSLSNWLNVAMLYAVLRRRDAVATDIGLVRRVATMALISALMGIMLLFGEIPLTGQFGSAVSLLILIVVGGIFYFAMLHVCGIARFGELTRLIKRQKSMGPA